MVGVPVVGFGDWPGELLTFDPLDPHAAAPIASAPTRTAGVIRWITVRRVVVVRFICLILLGDIYMVLRRNRPGGLPHHHTPGSNLHRTRPL